MDCWTIKLPDWKWTDFLDTTVFTLHGVRGISSVEFDLPRVLLSDVEEVLVSLCSRLAATRRALARASRPERFFFGEVDRDLEPDPLLSLC